MYSRPSYVREILDGKRLPSKVLASHLCDALGISRLHGQHLLAADYVCKHFGRPCVALLGKDPRYDKILDALDALSAEQRESLLASARLEVKKKRS